MLRPVVVTVVDPVRVLPYLRKSEIANELSCIRKMQSENFTDQMMALMAADEVRDLNQNVTTYKMGFQYLRQPARMILYWIPLLTTQCA